jgi:drug/metabolite transporter superfamily protein YnfA
MRMLRRKESSDRTDGRASMARDDRRSYTSAAPPQTAGERTWHRGPTRGVITLLAVGVAGLLAWLTTNIDDKTMGGYWAAYGILAGAGLVMALSQLFGGWTKWGRPRLSPSVFLLAFVPALVAVGWIVVFHQPHSNTFRSHVMSWSNDLNIRGFVDDMGGDLLTMLSFGLGLVFGFCFDTAGARRPNAMTPQQPMPQRTRRDTDADQPIARERDTRQRVPS